MKIPFPLKVFNVNFGSGCSPVRRRFWQQIIPCSVPQIFISSASHPCKTQRAFTASSVPAPIPPQHCLADKRNIDFPGSDAPCVGGAVSRYAFCFTSTQLPRPSKKFHPYSKPSNSTFVDHYTTKRVAFAPVHLLNRPTICEEIASVCLPIQQRGNVSRAPAFP